MIGDVPILWKSQLQTSTAMSSCEAEYVAIAEGTKYVLQLRNILKEIGFEQTSPTVIRSDSQSALDTIKSKAITKMMKHVATRYHRTRDEIMSGSIVMEKVATELNRADPYTKQLAAPAFARFFGPLLGIDLGGVNGD